MDTSFSERSPLGMLGVVRLTFTQRGGQTNLSTPTIATDEKGLLVRFELGREPIRDKVPNTIRPHIKGAPVRAYSRVSIHLFAALAVAHSPDNGTVHSKVLLGFGDL